MSLSIKQRLLLSFGLIIAMAIVVGVVGLINLGHVNQMVDQMSNNVLPGIKYAKSIDDNISDYRSAIRGYILSSSATEKEQAEKEISQSLANLEENKKEYEKTISTEEDQSTYDQFNTNWNNYFKYNVMALDQSRQGNDEEARAILNGSITQHYDRTQNELAKMVDLKNSRANEMYQMSQEKNSSAKITVIASIVLAGLAGLLLSILISRRIADSLAAVAKEAGRLADGDLTSKDISVRGKDEIARLVKAFNHMKNNLKTTFQQLTDISKTLYVSAQELAGQAQQTSAGANETAAAVGEISSTVDEVSLNAQNVATATGEASKNALEGSQNIQRINAQMNSIVTTSNSAASVINELTETLGRVNQIVELITSIADQTNLLALNAAIEAARAGEQGRGFAVVAEEVRKLAEQSAEAAKQISQLILQVQDESGKAVTAMSEGNLQIKNGEKVIRETGQSFNGIINIIEGLAKQIQDVAAATEQVSSGVQNIAATTEQQTASMEEVSAAAEKVTGMANKMDDIVKSFNF